MTYHVYIDRKPDGTPFYVGIGNAARVKNVQRNHWHRAIRLRYPNWTRTVVETASRELCMELEELLISEIGRRDLSTGSLVNFTAGGEGSPRTVVSDDTRRRMSESGKGKTKSEEWRKKISAAHLGKKMSDATKSKISEAKKGVKQSPAQIAKTATIVRARWKNPAYAKKMAAVVRKLWGDPEHKARMSEKCKARLANPETRASMVKSVKRAWANPELRARASMHISGRVWITDGVTSRRIRGEVIPDGWKRGRK